MRFAAAALMAGMVFLVVAISGFGGSPPGPSDFPQAIRLSGIGIQAPTELATAIPDTGTLSAAAGTQLPAVTVGHNVVPVPLMTAASPAPTARQQPNARPSTPTSNPALSTEPVPASGVTVVPAPPILTTTFSPVPPVPTPTPTPTPSPTATPTPKPTPTPTPTPTASPPSARRGLLRTLLGLPCAAAMVSTCQEQG
jgi:hypothetical protein